MGLGSRKASRHETAGVAKVAGVNPEDYWEFKPGTAVMTSDGIAGTVTAVLDGPVAGNEAYQVTLDKGMGGGLYTASQLSPAGTTTASVEHTAADDYPELGTILIERPDPAINTVLASKTASDNGEGAYVHHEWVNVSDARKLEHPNHDGPGAYSGHQWVPFTCAKCGETPSHCPHKQASKTALNDAEWTLPIAPSPIAPSRSRWS